MLKNATPLFVLTVFVFVYFLPSYTKMQDLKAKNQDYLDQIRTLEKKNEQLAREKDLLENDPAYLEKVAREKMGLAREGEVIYKIEPATPKPGKKQ